MGCHREALNNPKHACHGIVKEYQCEAFRFRGKTLLSRIDQVKVMFLGLSPGNPEKDHKPYTPEGGAQLEEVMKYLQKPVLNGIGTNFRNAMKERIGSQLEYVKANVVHAILDKEHAQACLETCGNKFLLPMLRLFCGLRYMIVYDFNDKKVLNYVNEKLHISPPLDFNNSTVGKGVLWNGVTVIAAMRKRRYIRRLS